MTDGSDFSLTIQKDAYVAFSYIDRVRKISDMAELRRVFSKEVNYFGYEHFMFVASPINQREVIQNKELSVWPSGWLDRYVEQGYVTHDPVVQETFTSALPFTWQDVKEKGSTTETSNRIFNEAREWRMNQGLCIPVHNLDHLQAAVTFAGASPRTGSSVQGALQLMVIYTDAKARELATAARDDTNAAGVFSRRERECILWIAAGKSTWEISQILGPSEETVRFYIKNAMRKTNVVTRAQLVATAIRLGEISM